MKITDLLNSAIFGDQFAYCYCDEFDNDEELREKCECGSWERMWEAKFRETINSPEFVDSILTKGLLYPPNVSFNENGRVMVWDGHHRIAIAILLMMDEIDLIDYKTLPAGYAREAHVYRA